MKAGAATSEGPAEVAGESAAEPVAPARRAARIVGGAAPVVVEPRELERQRLLGYLLAAQGRPSVTRAVDEYLAGSFELPRSQAVWLQVLEHRDERRVVEAIAMLRSLFVEPIAGARQGEAAEAPERPQVLESRLRRIEELAEEPPTREAAAELRRSLKGRLASGSGGTA